MARQSKDKAGTFMDAASKRLKTLHKNTGAGLSLKDFAKRLLRDGGDEGKVAEAWLYNKRLNSAAPPKKIGRTRKAKGSGKGSTPKKAVDGR